VQSYLKDAYSWNATTITAVGCNPVNLSVIITVIGTQSVTGNWTTGYTITYSGIKTLAVAALFTAPDTYELTGVGVTILPNQTESISFGFQQQKAIATVVSPILPPSNGSTVGKPDPDQYSLNQLKPYYVGAGGYGGGGYQLTFYQIDTNHTVYLWMDSIGGTYIGLSPIERTLVSNTPTTLQGITQTCSGTESQAEPVTFHRTSGEWNFSVTLSNLTVPVGQPIDVYVSLTNISGQTQTINEFNPIINPAIYNDGTQVWAWYPRQTNDLNNVTIGPGESIGPFFIPTCFTPTYCLSVGQNYTLSIWPIIGTSTAANGDYQLGESLMVNVTISVT